MPEKENYTTARKKWGILPTLDYYIFSQFMIPFSVLIIGFILLFIVGDIFNDLQDFLEADTEQSKAKLMIEYFLLLLPGNIRFILPISILLACMYTMANFGKNMEVTAMRASGISLLRCGGSIYVVGLVITGINFWFNEQLVPVCEAEAEVLKDKTTRGAAYRCDLRNMLTFVSSNKERIWLFKYFDISGIQKDVMVKKYRIFSGANGRRILSWDIKATEAAFIPGKGWTFRDGLLTEYTKDGFMPLSPKKFKEYSKNLEELPETPEEIMNAVKPPEDLPVWTIWKILNNTKDMDPKCRNVYSTIFYYRIAFPWACFLAVFLGVPLAAKNERAGIFQSIIIAIVVIVVYQMASEIFLVLGKRGLLPAIFAGLFPTLAFIGYGWYNIVRQQS